jgi:hypothetical protein
MVSTKARVIAGRAHAKVRVDGCDIESPTTVSCRVSISEISVRAAVVAGLALLALLLVAWRKPARPGTSTPPAHDESGWSEATSAEISPSLRKKTLETAGLGAIAIFGGIATAIVVSIALAWIVTNFLNRL